MILVDCGSLHPAEGGAVFEKRGRMLGCRVMKTASFEIQIRTQGLPNEGTGAGEAIFCTRVQEPFT